jgi:hypothetical protein
VTFKDTDGDIKGYTDVTDYSGITGSGEGMLYFDDLFAQTGELNWIPPQYGVDYIMEDYNKDKAEDEKQFAGTRYAYFLIKYSADNYSPRMRVWAYGDQTLSSDVVYQQHRVSDEGLNNYVKHSGVTAGYNDAVTAYLNKTANDAQKALVEKNIPEHRKNECQCHQNKKSNIIPSCCECKSKINNPQHSKRRTAYAFQPKYKVILLIKII